MARPAEISDGEITDAGQSLLAAGKRVTGYALRIALGDRGNPNRLKAVWDAHVAERSETTCAEEAAPLPPRIEDIAADNQGRMAGLLASAVQTIYREADATVMARLQEEREQLAEIRVTYEAEMAGAADALERGDQRIAALQEEIKQRDTRLTGAAEERIRLEERLKTAEDQIRLDAERSAAVSADLACRFDGAMAEAMALRQQIGILTAQVETTTGTITALRGELAAARAETMAAQKQFGALEALVLSANESAGVLRAELADARAETAAVRKQRDSALVDAGSVLGQLSEARKTYQQRQADAAAEIAHLRDRLAELGVDTDGMPSAKTARPPARRRGKRDA